MELLGTFIVSLLISFISASPIKPAKELQSNQAQVPPEHSLEQLPKSPPQSNLQTVLSDDATSQNAAPSGQVNLQADPVTDLDLLPLPINTGSSQLAGNWQNKDYTADRELTQDFVKSVLRDFFDELKKRPDIVQQILRYETMKELMGARQDSMLFPTDALVADLPILNPQPVEKIVTAPLTQSQPDKAEQLNQQTQAQTQTQAESLSVSKVSDGNSLTDGTATHQDITQDGDENFNKRDNSQITDVAGNTETISDAKSGAKVEEAKTEADKTSKAIPQDPFYYYFYYPEDSLISDPDSLMDTLSADETQVAENNVIDSLTKSVMAVLQNDLGMSVRSNTNTNTNTNIINNNDNNGDVSGNVETSGSLAKEEKANDLEDGSHYNNEAVAGLPADANAKENIENELTQEEDELSRLSSPGA